MASSENNLVNALIDYVKDIKPYHVKLRDFISELQFLDSMLVSFPEDTLEHTIHFTNVWGKGVFGAPEMSFVSDGETSSYYIPYCVKPKHDIKNIWNIDHQIQYEFTQPYFNYQVTSITDTPAGVSALVKVSFELPSDLANIAPNTIDISLQDEFENNIASCTKFGNTYYSNEFEIQEVGLIELYDLMLSVPLKIWLDIPCFRTEYHVGSLAYLNGIKLVYGTDYIVNEERSRFILLRSLTSTDILEVTLYLNDRLFIKQVNPFHFDITGGYDHELFDYYEYDCDGEAIFENFNYDVSIYEAELPVLRTDHFVLTIDKSYSSGYSSLIFNEVYPGLVRGKAKMNNVFIYPSEQTGNIWKISAIGNLSCSVQQIAPITGPRSTVTVGQRFDNGKIAFTLDGDWIDYYLIDEDASYSMFWRDTAELFMDVTKDSNVTLYTIGDISESNNYYKFTFTNTPLKNSYIEFRVEQQYQYNPRIHTTMKDEFSLIEAQFFSESICATSYASRGFIAYTPCATSIPVDTDMFPRQELPSWTDDVLPIVSSPRPMIDELFEESGYDTQLYEFTRVAYGLINIPLFEPTCALTCGGIVSPEVFEQTEYDTDLYETSHPECGVFPSITDELLITITEGNNTEIHSTVILDANANTYVAPHPITHLTIVTSILTNEIQVVYEGDLITEYTLTKNGTNLVFVFPNPITPAIFMDVACETL